MILIVFDHRNRGKTEQSKHYKEQKKIAIMLNIKDCLRSFKKKEHIFSYIAYIKVAYLMI
ncbi:hypothetical protein A0O00_12455 [Proteus mirabilis]|nr:hypothetical protein A0O00_12455 [Proteus mirabilis]